MSCPPSFSLPLCLYRHTPSSLRPSPPLPPSDWHFCNDTVWAPASIPSSAYCMPHAGPACHTESPPGTPHIYIRPLNASNSNSAWLRKGSVLHLPGPSVLLALLEIELLFAKGFNGHARSQTLCWSACLKIGILLKWVKPNVSLYLGRGVTVLLWGGIVEP